MITLNLPMNIETKKRGRPTWRGGKRSMYIPSQKNQNQLSMLARSQMNYNGFEGFMDPETDLFLTVGYYLERRYRVDTDNLLKQIKDALNGIAYDDDSQVIGELDYMVKGVGKGNGKVLVMVELASNGLRRYNIPDSLESHFENK